MKLTVYFDGQFWIGVVEEYNDGNLKAGRFVFGAEPHDAEILKFIDHELLKLTSELSQEVKSKIADVGKVNPKRLARKAAQEMKSRGISTFAQEALQLEYEKRKKEKQTSIKEQREKEKVRKRELKIEKAKKKHRGR